MVKCQSFGKFDENRSIRNKTSTLTTRPKEGKLFAIVKRQWQLLTLAAFIFVGPFVWVGIAKAEAPPAKGGPAQTALPGTFTLRGWYNYPPTCIVKGVKQFYSLQVQNVSGNTVTARIAPRGLVGATILAALAGASPSLRGTPPYDLYWEVTLNPGQTSRVLRVSYIFPTNVFGSRDHGGVFDLRTEIMDSANVNGALELVTHANECIK